MGTPTRFPGGLTNADEYQPLGQLGAPDPFFLAQFADDFLPYRAGDYTVTAAGGSVAATANGGTGGRILLTTGAVSGNFAAIQQPTANFANVPGKKLAFLTRLNLDDVLNSRVLVGLIDTRVTPLTPQDGIYFNKSAGGTALTLNAISAGVVVATANVPDLPNNGFLNDADIDLGFLVTDKGEVEGFVGYHLEGSKLNQNKVQLGPVVALRQSAFTAALTLLPLNPTVVLAAGTAAAQTGNCDFLYAAQER